MHQEAITSAAKKIFERLPGFSDFYLAGGTGLALQLGHRVSVDFDLFWGKEISKDLLAKVEKVFENLRLEVRLNHSEQLTVVVSGVNLSFVKYPFPLLLDLINYQGGKILPILEIGAMKAYTLGRRATFKDYVDLFFVLKSNPLEEIINLAQKKYQDKFDPRLFLEQLIYLEDVQEEKLVFLKEAVSKAEIANFFQQKVKEIKL